MGCNISCKLKRILQAWDATLYGFDYVPQINCTNCTWDVPYMDFTKLGFAVSCLIVQTAQTSECLDSKFFQIIFRLLHIHIFQSIFFIFPTIFLFQIIKSVTINISNNILSNSFTNHTWLLCKRSFRRIFLTWSTKPWSDLVQTPMLEYGDPWTCSR